VKDASGNPVSGVAVTFAVAPGNGTVTPTTPVTTGTDGIAAASSWTLSPTAGTNTLTATASGLTGSPVTFTATGTAGAATRLVITTPPSSSAQSGAPLAPQPTVQLQDANGNPVSQGGVVVTATPNPAGAAVTFAVAPGNGTVTPTTPVSTGTDGIAAAPSWLSSSTAGTNTLTATASGLTGSPVTFTATGTAGAATRLVLTTPPSATAQS